MIYNSILELIGNTPIVKINKLVGKDDATLLAKLEWYNIGGSVKDRMAKYLIEYAEASGKLKKDKIISGGNIRKYWNSSSDDCCIQGIQNCNRYAGIG